MEHPYFGRLDERALDAHDVIWEARLRVGAAITEVQLWVGPRTAPDAGVLDAFAARLAAADVLDVHARAALRATLQNERDYIDNHLDDPCDSAVIVALVDAAGGDEVSVDAFVAAMSLCGVGLWAGEHDAPIVLDYMIDPEASDEILAVKMSLDGTVMSVDWES